MSTNHPKVSVCVVTYNQKQYIVQCLQSLVDQQTNFSFEVIVGDDCSTDGTTEIVKDFATKYPDLIKPIYHNPNIGGTANYLAVHNAAKGEYIAHMDGDDYALPGKLQAQADFLDAHPRVNIVWHRVRLQFREFDLLYDDLWHSDYDGYRNIDLVEFVRRGFIGAHSSKMYRSCRNLGCGQELKGDLVDFSVSVFHIGDGWAVILPQFLGVYRTHAGVMISSPDSIQRLIRSTLSEIAGKSPDLDRAIFSHILWKLLKTRNLKDLLSSVSLMFRCFRPIVFVEFFSDFKFFIREFCFWKNYNYLVNRKI